MTEPTQTGGMGVARPSIFAKLKMRLLKLWHWRTAWAWRHLSNQMKKDPGYRDAWHANISMAMYDGTRPKCYCHCLLSQPDVRPEHFQGCEALESQTNPKKFECRKMPAEQSSYIADRIMKNLFDV
jgi:hypothetical protein